MANGFFTGIAVTVGGWLVTRHLLRHLENFEAKRKHSDNGKSEVQNDAGS